MVMYFRVYKGYTRGIDVGSFFTLFPFLYRHTIMYRSVEDSVLCWCTCVSTRETRGESMCKVSTREGGVREEGSESGEVVLSCNGIGGCDGESRETCCD